jgi:hypothetical protein
LIKIRRFHIDYVGHAHRQPSLRDHIRDLGIDLISYRPICDAMRRRPVAGTS